jgi:hypothetical protein
MRAAPLLLLLLAASCAPRAALKPLPEEPLALLEALRGQGLRASFALRGRDAQGRLYELTVAARASEAQGLSLRLYRTGLLVASLSPQDCSSAHPLFSPCGELLEALDRALRWWAVKEPRPPTQRAGLWLIRDALGVLRLQGQRPVGRLIRLREGPLRVRYEGLRPGPLPYPEKITLSYRGALVELRLKRFRPDPGPRPRSE